LLALLLVACTRQAAPINGSPPVRRQHRLAAAVLAAAPEVGRDRAAEIAARLAGLPRADRLVCGYARSAVEPHPPDANGPVPRANLLRAAWTAVSGELPPTRKTITVP
jgi:hypothetical protein